MRIIKFIFLFAACQFMIIIVSGQQRFQSTYYEQRRTLFKQLPNTKNEIIFLGNSITDGSEWAELFQNKRIKNRGISGDITEGVLYRLREITESKPAKVFLLIGINDLARNIPKDTVYSNICLIIKNIKEQSSKTKIFVQSILPVNPAFDKFSGHCSKTSEVKWINGKLEDLSMQSGFHYVDLFTHFTNEDDDFMNPEYTNDGLHLTGEGYMKWAEIIKPLL
jgi:lysophospholipase L1-like esterase